jgi:hypothetical protein
MLQIPLNGNGSGKFAIVDPVDFHELSRYSWHYKDGYAITKINRREVRMHRRIMNENDPTVIIDHIDRNRLNNTRSNLRRFTLVQNANNREDNVFINAFGESKTVAQWSRDPRCRVPYEMLRKRFENGMPAWAAILASSDDED